MSRPRNSRPPSGSMPHVRSSALMRRTVSSRMTMCGGMFGKCQSVSPKSKSTVLIMIEYGELRDLPEAIDSVVRLVVGDQALLLPVHLPLGVGVGAALPDGGHAQLLGAAHVGPQRVAHHHRILRRHAQGLQGVLEDAGGRLQVADIARGDPQLHA